jgi:aminoglycoside N3'-acetyltransferase
MKQRWTLVQRDVVRLPDGNYAVETFRDDDETHIHTVYGAHAALLSLRRAVEADLRRLEDDIVSEPV